MKILNFGSCNIDYVYSLDHIVESGETETSRKLETFAGGKGLNQSLAIAKAGAEIFHAGCVGCDGDMLLDIMSENGVDISYIRRTEQKNGHAIIQVSAEGSNSIVVYPGSNELISKAYIDSVLADFSAGDIIVLQNEISNVDYVIEKAYKKGMCISFNPSPFNDEIGKIDFNKLSYLILNEVEARGITGYSSPNKALDYIKNNYPRLKTVLTLGDRGSVYSDEANRIFQSAFKVEVADTTAAGDTFTGYFIAGLAKGKDYDYILKISSAASAIAVSQMGVAPSIPPIDRVLAELPQLTENSSDKKSETLKEQINSYIESNIKSANLGELSSILGYSLSYTGSLVKKLTGKSFSKEVQAIRCAEAVKLLTETDLPIETVIKEVGYENESFFRKILKENYNKAPSEIRKGKQSYDK